MGRPFEGIRVVEFSDGMAAPYATMLLANCGAEVIRLESRLHLGFRQLGPWGIKGSGPSPKTEEEMRDFSVSPLFAQLNRNKFSAALNITKPKGRELAKRLIKSSDIVIDNFKYSIMEKSGLDYLSLKQVKEDIIVIALRSMGNTGPYREWAAWAMNLMSFSGFTHEWGEPNVEEKATSPGYGDYVAGGLAAILIVAALIYRTRTGQGQFVDVSQVEATASVLEPIYLDYFVNHRNALPRGNRHPQFAPYNCYPCRGDDAWCVITVFNEQEWKQFCKAIGQPPWAMDSKFETMESRLKNVLELDQNIERWTRQYTPHQVMRILQSFGIAAGAVQNSENLYYDLQLRASGFMIEQNLPRFGKITYPGVPVHFSHVPLAPPTRAPTLGEHNDYIYCQLLGLSSKEVSNLKDEGVII